MPPPIDTATVAVVPDFSRFFAEFTAGMSRALGGLQAQVGRLATAVDHGFEQVAHSANRHLEGIGDTAFTGLKNQAERAGEGIERSFDEAKRGSDESLRDIGGPATFTPIKAQAKLAGESIEHSFDRASVSARASLGGLRVVGYGFGTALAGVFGLVGAAAAKMGLTAVAASEQAQISFGQLLGSGQKAQTFLAQLEHFAATTPFEMPGLVTAARQLLGVGQSAGDVIPIMTALGDATGALGLGQDEFQRIMLATTQAMAKGKLQGEELLQFLEAGLPIWDLLSKATGRSVDELRKMSERGELLSKDVLPLLFTQMEKDYGGSMAKQSRTLNGLWSTLMDTIRNGLRETLEPLVPFFRTTLSGAIGSFTGVFETVPGKIKAALDGVKTATIGDATLAQWGKTLISQLTTAIETGNWTGFKDMLVFMVKSAIFDLAEAEGLPAQAQSIIDGLAEGLRSGDWSAFGKALGDQASRFPTAILEGLSKVKWVKVGQEAAKFAVPFAIGFSAGLFDGLLEAFKEDFWQTVFQIAMIIPLGRVAGLLGRAFPILLRLPILGGLLKVFEGAGKVLERPLMRLFDRFGPDVAEGVSRVFPRIGRALERGLGRGGLLDHLRLVVGGWKDVVVQGIHDFAAAIGEEGALVVRNIGQFIGRLLRPFAGIGSWLLRRGGELLRGLLTGMRGFYDDISLGVRATIRRLLDPFIGIGRWLLRRGGELLRGLLTGMRGFWDDITMGIRLTIRRLLDPFRGIGRWLVQEGGDLLRGMLSGLRSIWGAVSAAVRATIRRLLDPFRGIGRWLVDEGRQLLSGLLSGLRSVWAAVSAAIRTTIRRLLDPFIGIGRWLVDEGRQLLNGLISGIRAVFGALSETIRAAIARVRNPFSGALSWLSRAGQNIIDGLISGMRSAVGSIGSVLREVKDAIVGGIKRLFGIRSPSTVMAGIGASLVAGLVKGLVGSQAGLRGVVRSLGVGTADLLGHVLGGVWQQVGGRWQKAISLLTGALSLVGAAGRGGIVAMVQRMAAAVGWTGAQWAALQQLIMHESGFNPNAQNPTSTAYGLFQFLNSTWGLVGATKTSDPAGQTAAGLRYIARVYGTPAAAWSAWLSRSPHWYDWGGLLPPGVRLGRRWLEPGVTLAGGHALINATGQRERVLAPGQSLVTVAPGAVQVIFNGPVDAATLGQVEGVVHGAFDELLRNLRAGV